jgi:hypothetical protein
MIIVKIEKVKSMLNLTTDEGKVYKIDFSTGDIIGVRGGILKSDPLIYATVSTSIPYYEVWNRFINDGSFFLGDTYFYGGTTKKNCRKNSEKFCSYLDILPTGVENLCSPKKIPKGYVNWCRENNRKMSNRSLEDFFFEEKIKNFPKKDILRLKNLSETIGQQLTIALSENEKVKKIAFTLIENDYKNFKYIQPYQCKDVIQGLITTNENWFDITAGITENFQLFRDYYNENRKAMIINQEKRIRELETIEDENFCVVVPKTLEDFTDEGKQQCNCVGSHYHDSIVRGENLIYFIRLKSNSEKSLNTCRYNISNERTVENKTYCNHKSSKEVDDFIKSIVDPKIRELLNV